MWPEFLISFLLEIVVLFWKDDNKLTKLEVVFMIDIVVGIAVVAPGILPSTKVIKLLAYKSLVESQYSQLTVQVESHLAQFEESTTVWSLFDE